MKFKCGDKVRFLNDTGGGVVNRIDDRGIVFVLTDDGFDIPVPEKELVLSGGFAITEDPDFESTTVSETAHEVKRTFRQKPSPAQRLPRNVPPDAPVSILLGFIPERSGPVFSSNLAFYLINDSGFAAYYHLGTKESGEYQYLASGMIEAETKNYISSFDQTSISKISDIHIQLIFLSLGKYNRTEPVDALVNLNLVNFSKESYYRENEYFNEKALLFSLHAGHLEDNYDMITVPEDAREQKLVADNLLETRLKKKEPAADTLEVDLHMDETDLQNTQLASAGILALQMSRFHDAIDEAISKRLRRLVIIHGLGQGTLKMQIRKELQEKYPQYIYQDASFKEYGFGATLVHLTIEKQQ
jgi:hypothetical protein